MIMPTISTDIQRISHQVRLSLTFENAVARKVADDSDKQRAASRAGF
jgi:hypothetical protein